MTVGNVSTLKDSIDVAVEPILQRLDHELPKLAVREPAPATIARTTSRPPMTTITHRATRMSSVHDVSIIMPAGGLLDHPRVFAAAGSEACATGPSRAEASASGAACAAASRRASRRCRQTRRATVACCTMSSRCTRSKVSMFEWCVRELYSRRSTRNWNAGKADGVERDVIGGGDRARAERRHAEIRQRLRSTARRSAATARLLCSQMPRTWPVPLSELK